MADAQAVAALAALAFRSPYRESWSATQIAAALEAAGAWLLLWEEGGGPLLGFGLARSVAHEAELLLCAVHPTRWRRGAGRLLVRQIGAEARARGAGRLLLEVRESNEAALALYRGEGFQPIGRRPGYYRAPDGRTADAITMALDMG